MREIGRAEERANNYSPGPGSIEQNRERGPCFIGSILFCQQQRKIIKMDRAEAKKSVLQRKFLANHNQTIKKKLYE